MSRLDDLSQLTEFAERLAIAAGEAAMPYFRSDAAAPENKAEAGYDPVTEADKAAERAMRALIEAERPEDGIEGEEYGSLESRNGWVWYLDPVDGTRAFVAGLPLWTILIGLVRDGEPIVGVIDQPYLGERYVGGPDGSYLTDRSGGKTSLSTRDCPALTDAILSTTDYFIMSLAERGAFEHLRATARLTRYGLDAYAYARLSAGTIDMVAETGLHPYDVAALIPVVRGAGGVATDWRGRPAKLGPQLVAAANNTILEEALISLKRSARD
ncbi:MAG: histidinol-phosphatase [Pseudomonadota bacterium]